MRNPKMYIFVGAGILILVVVIISLLTITRDQERRSASTTPITGEQYPEDTNPTPGQANVNLRTSSPPSKGVIAKVGEELIYESDLNYELSFYPASNDGEPETILFKKLIEDSVLLQAAQDEGYTTLDSSIFNSPTKDYAKRIETVMRLKDEIEQKTSTFEGSVIAIWFHNQTPGSVGYERGKQIAQQEMNTLLTELSANRITMQQAGERIRANQNLAQVDSSWKANAFFDFAVPFGGKITYSKEIDRRIFNVDEGQLSGIITGKDLDPQTGKQIDAVYMIAEVTKQGDRAAVSYDKWFTAKLKEYEVTRY